MRLIQLAQLDETRAFTRELARPYLAPGNRGTHLEQRSQRTAHALAERCR
ncbi:Uncharacterised protein [Mycobacterium tuberculosis]|uniref:Uncharacterized protein n=1 Tax=Mycobacterium tuberculosis TaxID=1773 RepID=A0A0U0S4M9_MYCTX|nr:hypothetical protein FJ05194_2090 [Mycobacterium tuberculosis FJ05194]KAF3410435.1 hypothetical protein BIS44_0023 [Mycobacterium tuberculosis variant bovis BCG]KAF3419289.1 hypothetical protein BIT17_1770 [Mycobacterium tuberculosis variant bovis]COV18525.1 Uncharacterised protein [Mycobacterium tuberculosis]BAQ06581.1 hypothetical protein KURONO_2791 [Mycobacterium tuberculosis str. Kurono]